MHAGVALCKALYAFIPELFPDEPRFTQSINKAIKRSNIRKFLNPLVTYCETKLMLPTDVLPPPRFEEDIERGSVAAVNPC
jgi:hypothetical protein